MKFSSIIIVVSILVITSCNSNDTNEDTKKEEKKDVKVSYIHQNDQTSDAIKHQGARIVKQTEVALGTALKKAMAEDGPEYAIQFCNHEAMPLTDSISKAEGVTIRRIAKKNRNPKNETNDVESKVFKQYIMEYLAGVTLKPRIASDAQGHPVYYKPIITNNMCLTCHGKPGETMTHDIAKKIKELYPNDKAINFESGHPRGMWAITFTKLNINPN